MDPGSIVWVVGETDETVDEDVSLDILDSVVAIITSWSVESWSVVVLKELVDSG